VKASNFISFEGAAAAVRVKLPMDFQFSFIKTWLIDGFAFDFILHFHSLVPYHSNQF